MAFQAGWEGYISLNAIDISAKTISCSLDKTIAELETSTLGDVNQDFIPGLKGATVAAELLWDTTLDGQLATMESTGIIAFSYQPEGNTGGDIKYTGNCFITALGSPVAVGEVNKVSVSLRITGAVTRGTV